MQMRKHGKDSQQYHNNKDSSVNSVMIEVCTRASSTRIGKWSEQMDVSRNQFAAAVEF